MNHLFTRWSPVPPPSQLYLEHTPLELGLDSNPTEPCLRYLSVVRPGAGLFCTYNLRYSPLSVPLEVASSIDIVYPFFRRLLLQELISIHSPKASQGRCCKQHVEAPPLKEAHPTLLGPRPRGLSIFARVHPQCELPGTSSQSRHVPHGL